MDPHLFRLGALAVAVFSLCHAAVFVSDDVHRCLVASGAVLSVIAGTPSTSTRGQ